MKKLILISFIILALFGCTKTAEKSLIENQMALNQTIQANNLSVENLITVSGDENIAKIEIKASNLQFPLKKYEKQFVNVGLHSEAFLKLDKSHISFLDDGEAIWLTPMIKNNSGVLFNAIYSNDIIQDEYAGKTYNKKELVNESGLFLEFDPVMPICTDKNCSREEYLTERHHVTLGINGKDLLITKLEKNNVVLAKEESFAFLNRYSCAVEHDNTIKVGNKTFAVDEFYNRHEPNAIAVFYSLDSSTRVELGPAQTKEIGSAYLHVWYFGFDYTFCADWVGVSSLSEIINLTDENIVLTWENENSSNQALKSLYVPRNSAAFEKLFQPIKFKQDEIEGFDNCDYFSLGENLTLDNGYSIYLKHTSEWNHKKDIQHNNPTTLKLIDPTGLSKEIKFYPKYRDQYMIINETIYAGKELIYIKQVNPSYLFAGKWVEICLKQS